MYRYTCTAVDSSGNESDSSLYARGKPVTLDHGILLVDETRDGTGGPGNPSDEQQDRFYHAMLAGYSFIDWDVAADSLPLAGDVGPYSTVVWHGDDYSQQQMTPALPGLANYLGYGGRLWLVGWKPVAALMGSGAYPFTFTAGQFPYDLLHLSAAQQSSQPDFIGATGLAAYPNVTVDSTKWIPSMHGRLPYIDALIARDAEPVLSYNSFSGDTFQGKPVGVRWLSAPGKTVFLGFPFYYVKDDEARLLACKVLDDLGEPYGIEERPTLDASRITLEVRPNPTRPGIVKVKVSGQVARWSRGPVRLSVYDASGRALHSALCILPSELALRLATGAYFVRLTASPHTLTSKLVVQ
jgi:hypothetical protein